MQSFWTWLWRLDVRVFERGPTLQIGHPWQEWWDALDRFERRRVFEAAQSQIPRDAHEAAAWAAILRARAATMRERTPMVRRAAIAVLALFAAVITLAEPTVRNLFLSLIFAVGIGWASTAVMPRTAARLDHRADLLDALAAPA